MGFKQHPRAQLADFTGPIYPFGMNELAIVYAVEYFAQANAGGPVLRILNKIMSFRLAVSRTTTDGYAWHSTLEFNLGGGKLVVVALPVSDLVQGAYRPQRSPAVYTQGEVSAEEIDSIVSDLIRLLA